MNRKQTNQKHHSWAGKYGIQPSLVYLKNAILQYDPLTRLSANQSVHKNEAESKHRKAKRSCKTNMCTEMVFQHAIILAFLYQANFKIWITFPQEPVSQSFVHLFDSRSGHTPGLQARSPMQGV
uniref:Uncharacterized protein n=1 Tax=Pipistrellus kuhlii TaxID=59472 RepID=A0A7J7VC23_PIPKU|nr:hypothetical protein mPipKuh1_008524 [Pipistrellus kuhlii]